MINRHFRITKYVLAAIILTITSFSATCQYFYKDLITTNQINNNFKVYRQNKISSVTLKSFQGNIPVTEGFVCEQKVNLSRNQVVTYTKTADQGETYFTAYYNTAGLLIKTSDSSQESVSISVYAYDEANRLLQLSHTTRATDNSSTTTEIHLWQYSANGKPEKMLRIRNGNDSTVVSFTLDDKGNVSEEQAVRKKVAATKVYYYYDEKNRLTDVVRYNIMAKRLLPDYMFEYEDNGDLSTMTVVPEGTSDYQKWYYKYDDAGLKLIEFCYNKKKELLGKIEYSYTPGR